jgi:prevent-host-death family protein
MKTVSVAEAQSDFQGVLDSAQKERIIVVRAGKPSAVIFGIETYDEEDRALAGSPQFWQMIEERRKGAEIPLGEIRKRLKLQRHQRKSPKSGSTALKKIKGQ